MRWTARAISSLPVPVSPRIRTVASVGATSSTSWLEANQATALTPTISSKSCTGATWRKLRRRSLSIRPRSRRSCTKAIHRNGASFNTAVAISTGTRAPSLPVNSFSNGVQAPKRKPSSCANSSNGAYSGGVRSGQWSRPPSRSSRVYPIRSRNASLASVMRSNSPETIAGHPPAASRFAAGARDRAAAFHPFHAGR